MKPGKKGRNGIVWILAALLFIAAVLTVPLSAAKYMATGEGMAQVRVAAWDVKFPPVGRLSNNHKAVGSFTGLWHADPRPGDQKYYYSEAWLEFAIANDGEVAAAVTFWVGYVDDYNLTPDENSPKVPTYGMIFFGHNGSPNPINNGDGTWTFERLQPGQTVEVQVHFRENGIQGFDNFVAAGHTGNRNCFKCKLFFTAVQVD
ncbi:MAG: hypothetical protein FWH26_01065 [Oscillospiraceae bacterium]|nr:hypothetical protein [Oscillospiraceae bacterium]